MVKHLICPICNKDMVINDLGRKPVKRELLGVKCAKCRGYKCTRCCENVLGFEDHCDNFLCKTCIDANTEVVQKIRVNRCEFDEIETDYTYKGKITEEQRDNKVRRNILNLHNLTQELLGEKYWRSDVSFQYTRYKEKS